MPPLHPSLLRLRYPMGERVAFYTQTLLCRSAGSYALEHPPPRSKRFRVGYSRGREVTCCERYSVVVA